MAAKKAKRPTPPRPPSPKPSPKKATPKPSMRKVTSKPKSKKNDVEVAYGTFDTDYGKIKKAGQDARKRASKYGKPVGKTNVYGTNKDGLSMIFGRSGRNKETTAYTNVKSARGNMYTVGESKTQVKLGRDKNRTTEVYPRRDTFKATGRRDAKFGPAPKKKK